MTPPDALEILTAGRPHSVDIPAIEKQLRELWSAAGTSDPDGAVTRASLLNLIVVATRTDADIAACVAAVASELPCRAIVLEPAATGGAAIPLEAWISAHCRPGGPAGKQVCCEQITIRATPAAVASLPSTLLGLLLPDLPTVLYAPGQADLAAALLLRVARHIDRLVVDSAGFADPDGDLAGLDDRHGAAVPLEIADLNWGRLEAWRELIAVPFDTAPYAAELAGLVTAEIDYDPGGRAQALLLAGWLVSRLGWQPTRAGNDRIDCTTPHGALALGLRPAAPAGARSSGLRRVALRGASGTAFVVEVDADHPTLLVGRIERDAACPLPQRLERQRVDPHTELVQLLMRVRRNPAFDAALAGAARLARLGSAPA